MPLSFFPPFFACWKLQRETSISCSVASSECHSRLVGYFAQKMGPLTSFISHEGRSAIWKGSHNPSSGDENDHHVLNGMILQVTSFIIILGAHLVTKTLI